MTEEEFKEQAKCRKEEIGEMEVIVNDFARALKVDHLLKKSMIAAFRAGMANCLEWLDRKAVEQKRKRDFTNKMLNETRGN